MNISTIIKRKILIITLSIFGVFISPIIINMNIKKQMGSNRYNTGMPKPKLIDGKIAIKSTKNIIRLFVLNLIAKFHLLNI